MQVIARGMQMFEIEIPPFFIKIEDLLNEYLNRPELTAKKQLVEQTIQDIDAILTEDNSSITIDGETATPLEFYMRELITDKSYILIIALLRPDLYQWFKSDFLRDSWNAFLELYPAGQKRTGSTRELPVILQCLIDSQQKNSLQVEQAHHCKPFPNQHALDTLLSNFLCQRGSDLEKSSDCTEVTFLKAMSFYVHAAVYNGLTAIERVAYYTITYLTKNPDEDNISANLITFLQAILDNTAEMYLHLGLRLRGVCLIKLAEIYKADAALAKEYFDKGITDLLIAEKLEQHVCEVELARHYQKTPVLKFGKFSHASSQKEQASMLVEKLEVTSYVAWLLGFYQRGAHFETVSPTCYVDNCRQYGMEKNELCQRIETGDIALTVEKNVNSILEADSPALKTTSANLSATRRLISSC